MSFPTATALDPMAARALKELKGYHRRFTRWHSACDVYCTAREAGLPAEPPNVRQMPSKVSKYRMYEAAGRLIAASGIDHPRPMSLSDLAVLIARFGG